MILQYESIKEYHNEIDKIFGPTHEISVIIAYAQNQSLSVYAELLVV